MLDQNNGHIGRKGFQDADNVVPLLFGDTGLGWRLPSVIAAALALVAVFGIVRALGGSRWTGVLAVAIYSLDPLSFIHGRIGVLDGMMVSFALLGTVTGEGSEGWSATALVEGRLAGSEGTADVTLTLTSPDGTAIWTGSALLASAPDSSGYDLTGSYSLAGAPDAMAGLPTFGGLSGRLALTGGSLARLFLGLA